jgi:hypothetical protein
MRVLLDRTTSIDTKARSLSDYLRREEAFYRGRVSLQYGRAQAMKELLAALPRDSGGPLHPQRPRFHKGAQFDGEEGHP